jgi:hypothetical protein
MKTTILATLGAATMLLAASLNADVIGVFKNVSFWAAEGGKKIEASGGSGILKNEEGEVVADGALTSVCGMLVIKGLQNSSFVHNPAKKPFPKSTFPRELPNEFARIDLTKGNRWVVRDTTFYFVLEIPKLNAPQIAVNLDKSLARASIVTLAKGSYSMWGYLVAVTEVRGSVTFANGKVIKASHVTVK